MDTEIKRKWVKALRSGKYKQTRGRLKARNGAMCCLGVLEHKVLGVPYKWWPDQGIYLNSEFSYTGPTYRDTIMQSGLTTPLFKRLADLNDLDKWSFEQIADWIEEKL